MAERLTSDRMFAVIVLGGFAIAAAACGGNVVVDGALSGSGGGKGGHGGGQGGISTSSTGFPQEGPGPTTGGFGGFNGAGGGVIVDAGTDGFPQETDLPPPDAGTSSSSGFPGEAP